MMIRRDQRSRTANGRLRSKMPAAQHRVAGILQPDGMLGASDTSGKKRIGGNRQS